MMRSEVVLEGLDGRAIVVVVVVVVIGWRWYGCGGVVTVPPKSYAPCAGIGGRKSKKVSTEYGKDMQSVEICLMLMLKSVSEARTNGKLRQIPTKPDINERKKNGSN